MSCQDEESGGASTRALADEVRRLAAIVPREPGTELPPGASDRQIAAFEEARGIVIPDEVRTWLRFTDGPRIGPGCVFGLNDVATTCDLQPEYQDRRWLPVANDGCGDDYVLALDSADRPHRPVYFLDAYDDARDGRPDYVVASVFWRFLWFLFRQELGERRWPFDATFVLAHDPDLVRVTTAPWPWLADDPR